MTTQQRDGKKLIQVLWWPTAAFVAGLVLLYVGERAIGEPAKLRYGVDALAALGLLGGIGGRLRARGLNSDDKARRAEGLLLGAMAAVLAGVAVYLVFSVGRESMRDALGKAFDGVAGAAAVLWPALVVAGTIPLLLMQRALQSMTDGEGHAEHVEIRRVTFSGQSGLTVAAAVVFCFAGNYLASDTNKKVDLARFRSTRPSAATQRIVQNLSKPLRATLFFPATNEVREQVEPYFADLARLSKQFTYEVVDHALSPLKAKELSASGNGLVIFNITDDKGAVTRKETVSLATTLEAAGPALSTFDGDVQKRMLQITRPGRVAYFTVGHGERGFNAKKMELGKEDLRAPISGLQQLLESQGYEVKTLGVGQGLANQVPADAGIVFIVGAVERFLPEEVSALSFYLQHGGHVFVMLEPLAEATAADLAPLLKAGGVKFHGDMLCNNENFWPRAHEKSDFANIASTSFSSHASVATLSRAAGRVAMVLPHSGWLERDGVVPSDVKLDFTVRSMPKTWADANHDFEPSPDEKQQVFDLAAAASKVVGDPNDKVVKEKPEMRLLVLASVEAVTDMVLGHRPNLVFALDSVKWLIGDEAITAEVSQEQDLPIVHTKSEDKRWFYLTVFAAPALVLAAGLLYTRRVRRKRAS